MFNQERKSRFNPEECDELRDDGRCQHMIDCGWVPDKCDKNKCPKNLEA